MIARYAGRKSGALNCDHGAPDSLIGGWQAVNLTLEQWTEFEGCGEFEHLLCIRERAVCGGRSPFTLA